MRALTSLVTVSDVEKVQGFCRGMLRRGGVAVNGTKEQPVSGEFLVPPWGITGLVDNLRAAVTKGLDTPKVARIEFNAGARGDVAVYVCKDELVTSGRSAVSSNGGSYDHFFFRDGALYHVVHESELALDEMLAHFYSVLRTEQAVIAALFPDAKVSPLKRVVLRWAVDCLFVPVKDSAPEKPVEVAEDLKVVL